MIAVMQGRLTRPADGRIQSFPREGWAGEIAASRQASVGAIEWIYDTFGEGANPIETDGGIGEIRSLLGEHQVVIESCCADWFMDEPLTGGTEADRRASRSRLEWLIGRAELLGIRWIVLPFVDAASLAGPAEVDQAVSLLCEVAPLALASGLSLHLETDLDPSAFAELLSRVPHANVGVNYDTGNSAALGYDPVEELTAYGHRLGSVHIKDRVRGGTTVALGSGDTDFATVVGELRRLAYGGSYVLQVARGEPGHEVSHIAAAARFTAELLSASPVGAYG